MIKAVFLAFLFASLFTAHAEAAPLAAAVAAVSAWWAGAGLIIKLGVMLAINVGVGLLEQYRARKAAKKASDNQPRGVTLQVQVGDTLPRSYILGTRATAGSRKYVGAWGEEDKTPNAYLVDVRELSCLPSHAGPTGLQSVRMGDIYVTVQWDQPHPDGRGYPVREYRSDGRDYMWVKYLDGSQTTADPYLLAKFGGRAERSWKPTMVGRGCQAVIVTLRRHEEMFASGIPEMLFVPQPMRLYDVRKDSTAGGSGAHRWADTSTWEPSDNLPLMAYNVARGLYYGERWVHGGRNFSGHRLPASSWMAAMNEADRDMGSGRRQFRGGLEVRVSEAGLDILEKLRVGCAGRYAEVGGSLKMLVGAPAAAVWAMTDETIVVTRDQDFEPFPSSKKAVNTIRATYPEPALGWRDKEAPQRSSAALLERDGGEELAVDVDLEAVEDAAQVQCLSATMIEEAQRWRTHRMVLPPPARPLEPNDVFSWSSARNGYSNKKFIISRIVRLTGCLWEWTFQELEPSDYDPPLVILPPVTGPTGPSPVPVQSMTGWAAWADYIRDAEGIERRPAIFVSCASDLDDVMRVWVQVRLKATAKIVFDSDGTPYAAPHQWSLSGDWLLPATEYEVQGKLIPFSNRSTAWSEWLPVLTHDVRLSIEDLQAEVRASLETLRNWIDDETIDGLVQDAIDLAAAIAAEASDRGAAISAEQAARVSGAIEASDRYRSLVDEVTALRDRAMEADFADYVAREEIKRSLVASIEGYAASFDERITVAASERAAIAQRTTMLEATAGALGASISTVDEARIAGQAALAYQMSLLSAGTDNQFDPYRFWGFADGVEGWGGNGAPSVTDGYMRPANEAADPYVISPDGLAIPASTYRQVRARVRKYGNPVWEGQLWWAAVGEALDAGRRSTIAEPVFDGIGIGLLTWNPEWTGQIDRIRIDLSAAQTGTDYYTIDWISVGAPSPGASRSELAVERQARIDADSAQAGDIVALTARATDLETGVSGLAAGVSALETSVSTLGDTVIATGSALDALALQVDDKAELDVVTAMAAEISALETGLTSQGSLVSGIRSSLLPSAMEGVDQDFANFLGRQKDAVALTEASQSLNSRIDLTNSSLSVVAEAVTQVQAIIPELATAGGLIALTTRVTATEAGIAANASAITALSLTVDEKADLDLIAAMTAEIEALENGLVNQGSAVTSIRGSLLPSAMEGVDQDFANFLGRQKDAVALTEASQTLNSRIDLTNTSLTAVAQAVTQVQAALPGLASASALNLLAVAVGVQGDAISAQATAITGLQANIGELSAEARLKMEVVAGPAGYSRIGWMARAGTTGTFQEGGIYLDVPANPLLPVEVLINAARLSLIDGATKLVPFVVEDGVLKAMFARFNVITAGTLRSEDSKFVQTVQTGTFEWFE